MGEWAARKYRKLETAGLMPGNPNVGSFSAGKITFSPPASGDVLYSVAADATKPMSGGMAICSPSSLTANQDTNGMTLKVTAGATITATEIDFAGCT
jgi:hypothetical protein